jgi:hypothetical protein
MQSLKILFFLSVTLMAGLANATVYQANSSTWYSSLCYTSGVAPDSALEAVERDAKRDACQVATQNCLVDYAAKHPKRVFDCNEKESSITEWSNHVWQLPGITQCEYTNYAMAYAIAECIVEVVPQ